MDAYCRRRFWADTDASDRVYGADDILSNVIYCDDIADPSGVTLTSSTSALLDASTWTLYPLRPGPEWLVSGSSLFPRNIIRRLNGAKFSIWPDETITVHAKWGCPVVPEPVKQATTIIATRLYKRKDSPEGVAGFGEFGVVRIKATDPDVANMLDPYALERVL